MLALYIIGGILLYGLIGFILANILGFLSLILDIKTGHYSLDGTSFITVEKLYDYMLGSYDNKSIFTLSIVLWWFMFTIIFPVLIGCLLLQTKIIKGLGDIRLWKVKESE